MTEQKNKIREFIENEDIPNKGKTYYMSRGVTVINNKNAIRVSKNQITLLNNVEMEIWKACKFGPRTSHDLVKIIGRDHPEYYPETIINSIGNLHARSLLYAEEARNPTVAKILLMSDFTVAVPKDSFFKKMVLCRSTYDEYGFSSAQFSQIFSLLFIKQVFLSPTEYSLLCILKNKIPLDEYILSKKNISLFKTDQEYIRENLIKYSQAYLSLLRKLIIMTY